jgi:F-type H+-transporting ATPase subunit alpha
MPVEEQVAIIYCGSTGILSDIPTARIKEFEASFLDLMKSKYRKELDILKSGKITDEVKDVIKNLVLELSNTYKV